VQYGPGPGNGNKKPLIIGGAIIGAIWLLNSTYRDGFMDGIVVSGKGGYMHHMGGGFPWGLLIIGGILYFFWKKGSFDRFNGRGPVGPGGYGPPATMQQGPDPRAFMNPEQRAQWEQQQAQWAQRYGQGQQFRGPRGFFDDWHRQAHEGFNHQTGAPTPPPPYSPQAGSSPTPPPPPAADYWTNVNRPAEANAEPQGPTGGAGAADGTAGASGPTGSQPEQW
jgi:hypothetical protein